MATVSGLLATEVASVRVQSTNKIMYLYKIADNNPAVRDFYNSRRFCYNQRSPVDHTHLTMVKIESEDDEKAFEPYLGASHPQGGGNTNNNNEYAWIAHSPTEDADWEWADGTRFAEWATGTPIEAGVFTDWSIAPTGNTGTRCVRSRMVSSAVTGGGWEPMACTGAGAQLDGIAYVVCQGPSGSCRESNNPHPTSTLPMNAARVPGTSAVDIAATQKRLYVYEIDVTETPASHRTFSDSHTFCVNQRSDVPGCDNVPLTLVKIEAKEDDDGIDSFGVLTDAGATADDWAFAWISHSPGVHESEEIEKRRRQSDRAAHTWNVGRRTRLTYAQKYEWGDGTEFAHFESGIAHADAYTEWAGSWVENDATKRCVRHRGNQTDKPVDGTAAAPQTARGSWETADCYGTLELTQTKYVLCQGPLTCIPSKITANELTDKTKEVPQTDKKLRVYEIVTADTPAADRTIEKSRAFCAAQVNECGRHHQLVQIGCLEEETALNTMSLLTSTSAAWIASSPGVGERWEWTDGTQFALWNGAPVSDMYSNWATQPPQDAAKRCVRHVGAAGWQVASCDNTTILDEIRYILCQEEMVVGDQCNAPITSVVEATHRETAAVAATSKKLFLFEFTKTVVEARTVKRSEEFCRNLVCGDSPLSLVEIDGPEDDAAISEWGELTSARGAWIGHSPAERKPFQWQWEEKDNASKFAHWDGFGYGACQYTNWALEHPTRSHRELCVMHTGSDVGGWENVACGSTGSVAYVVCQASGLGLCPSGPTCPVGKQSSEGPFCSQCPSGFEPNADQDGCNPCDEHTYQDGTTNGLCASCPPGTQFVNATQACQACGNGTKNNPISASAGEQCSFCALGEQPNTNKDGCDPCPKNTYQDGTTNGLCASCPAGTQFVSPEQPCSPCGSGMKNDDVNAAAGSQCSFCALGEQPNTNNDGCDPCVRNTYQDGTTNGLCASCPADTQFVGATQACQACDAGTTNDAASAAAGIQCGECAIGKQPNTNDGCDPCPKNTYQDGTTSGVCASCPAGTQFVSPEQPCSPCGSGMKNDAAGAAAGSQCSFCAPGEEPNVDQDECRPCDTNTYQDGTTGGVCKSCVAPMVFTSSTEACVLVCQAGTEPNADQDGCNPCDEHTYQDGNTGGGVCKSCAAGTELVSAADGCRPCVDGTQNNASSAAAGAPCHPCPSPSTVSLTPNVERSDCVVANDDGNTSEEAEESTSDDNPLESSSNNNNNGKKDEPQVKAPTGSEINASPGVIAGSTTAGCFVFALTALSVWCCCCRRSSSSKTSRKRKGERSAQRAPPTASGSTTNSMPPVPSSSTLLHSSAADADLNYQYQHHSHRVPRPRVTFQEPTQQQYGHDELDFFDTDEDSSGEPLTDDVMSDL